MATQLNPDDIQDHDGTMSNALQLWSARNGPVDYNTWQGAYFAIRRHDGGRIVDTEAAVNEEMGLLQARIRRMYREIQEELHGPGWMADVVLAKRQRVERAQAAARASAAAGVPPMVPEATGEPREPGPPLPPPPPTPASWRWRIDNRSRPAPPAPAP